MRAWLCVENFNEATVFNCGIGIRKKKKSEIVINKMIKRTRIASETVPFNNISMGFIDWIIYFSRVLVFVILFFADSSSKIITHLTPTRWEN